ncbi:Sugar (and other) transporter [Geosmithia morbida]|uniref:Sugar (And other) transporter n=1 Tax=Geosmithia morbida TaxID=1094350 RepID=A0A9P4YPJ0_9HYPO|nr:Sugar (and other) transporter [Geosmithia morbida]KAF4119680.1 Sugar (and other) transporter [Geosmithia morbida]
MAAFKSQMGDFSDTIHGVVVSSSLITGAISACVAGILADKYGRIKMISIGAFIDGVGAAIECGSPSIGVFILGRLIKGAGNGLFLSGVYVQVSEISPSRLRGVLTSLPQFTIVSAIVIGYFVCYGTATIEHSSASWRIPLAMASGLAFSLGALVLIVPPSPRWLLAKGDKDRARHTVQRLGFDRQEQDDLLEREPEDLHLEQELSESFLESLVHMLGDFKEAFSKPYRSRTLFGCFILAMQQLAGIDGVLYYAPILFRRAGLKSSEASFLASGVSAIVIFVATFVATFMADRWGRRTSSLVGGVSITTVMALMGGLYAGNRVHPDNGVGRWVVIVCIYLFAFIYSATWALSFRIYLVESLPRKTRSSASSLAQSANWVANYVVALITPVLLSASTSAAYFLFGGMALIATVGIAFFMVETRGASLEEIEDAYNTARSAESEKRSHTDCTVTPLEA